MKDVKKTKEQLIDELGQLRRRIAELEVSAAERKKMAEALRESEAKYKEIAESITDVFFAMDEKLRYTYWNKASEELTGISAKDALGKRLTDIFPDDEATRIAADAYRRAMKTKEAQHFINNFAIGGRDFVFDISAYPTKDGLCVYVKDITERKKLEEALEESELWYRHVFDNAPFGIGFASTDGKVISLNKAMETITGYSAEEFTKINLADTYVNKADRQALLQEVRQHGGVVDYPTQLRRKDGTPYDVLLSARLTTIGDREFIQTICQDITERKRAGEELRRSEERFRTFFEDAPVYCYIVSPDGEILDINEVALETLGYTKEEVIGKPLIDMVYVPGSRPKARRLFAKWKEAGKLENEELSIITKEGAERTVLLSAHAVRDAGGKLLHSISMQRDITERKQVEDALRESEERYRFLVELSPEAIFVASEGKHVFVNSAGLKLFGASSPDQIIGKPVMDVIHPDYCEIVAERMRKSMETGIVAPALEEKFVQLDGTEVDVEVRAAPLFYQGKPAMQAVVRDITERKRAEEMLRSIFRAAPIGIGVVVNRVLMEVNQRFCEMTGYTSDELINKSARMVYASDADYEFVGREKYRQIAEWGAGTVETRFRHKDGTVIDVILSSAPMDPADPGRGVTFTVLDITERKRAEESLRLSEQNFRDSIENSPLGIRIVSEDGKTLYANQALLDIYGYSSLEELEAVPRRQRYTPESYEEHRERKEKRKRGEYVSPNYEISTVRKDGQVRNLLVSRGKVLWDGEKQFQVIYQDITERKQAEQMLRQSEEHFRALIENSLDVVAIIDSLGTVKYQSPNYKNIWGRDPIDEIGSDIFKNVHPDDIALIGERFDYILRNPEDTVNMEVRGQHGDGSWRIVDVVGRNLLEHPAIRGIVVNSRDITVRKQAEEKAARLGRLYAVLGSTNEAVVRIHEVEKLCQEICRIAVDDGGFRMVWVGLVDLDTHVVKPVAYHGFEDRYLKRVKISIDDVPDGRGPTGTAIREGRYDICNDWEQDPRMHPWRVEAAKRGYRSSASFPLRLGAKVIGALSFYAAETNFFTEQEATLLDRMAANVSFGIESIEREKQRKKFEEQLQQEKDRAQRYLDVAGVMFIANDADGRVSLINRKGCQILGYKQEEIIGKNWFDTLIPERVRDEVKAVFNKLMAGEVEPVEYFENPVLNRNGGERIIAWHNVILKDAVGKIIGTLSSGEDITEREKAEEALRASEVRYRLLAENVRDVIWAMDMDLRFIYVSPSVKYLGGRTAEEVMSMSIGQLLTLSSQELAMKTFAEELVMANVTPLDPTRSRTLEVEILRRDGSTLWVELKMNFMRDPAGRAIGILGVMRDISERKKAEEERREFEQKAQLASRLASVGEMAAGIAHEINNPLTGVIGYSELLMQEDVPEHIRSDLEVIHDGAKRVAGIVKGLLTFARQTRPERTVVDINQVIEVVLRLRAYELGTSNIKVTTKLVSDLPLTFADPGQLQQVFLNLIINAEMEMKLARGKGKLIIKTEQLGNAIRISFKDDGLGIAEENLDRIFDPFFTTREIGKGTGLGLSICHGIVTEHGGRIWAESKLDKGATFIVELPIVTEEKRPRQVKPAREPKKAAKGKILVVDDEPVVRRLLSQVLTEEGHEVEATDDGKDALNRIKSNRYNLILLDIKLPGMSGSELYERIKEIAESLAQRVVFITGDVIGVDTEAFIARTGVPYIHKPFDVKKLSTEIKRLLATPRPKGTAKSKIRSPKS
ncbi:MAG: PAS domain S-box protein [Chloroflexi bacterium]|nr:PAS domain S-box protein [Chloroflexota bacterium]